MATYYLKTDIQNYDPVLAANATWMITNYGINEHARLFRSYTPRPMPGCIMAVGDQFSKNNELAAKKLQNQAIAHALSQSIIKEALHYKYAGVYLSFSHPCDLTVLAHALLKQAGRNIRLLFNANQVSRCPSGIGLVLCPNFDRGFQAQVTSFCGKNKETPLCIEIDLSAYLFPLPDLSKSPSRLVCSYAPELCSNKGASFFYDSAHLCHYATFMQDDNPSICLFDTPKTFLEKMAYIKNTTQISATIIDYDGAAGLLGNDFAAFLGSL